MKESKHIRVYGTLLNYTLDPNKSNGVRNDSDFHNDAIAYANQLFDDRFGEAVATNNYQDVINKRLTAIQYADTNGGVTTIENRDGSTGDPYILVVKGNTNIEGDLYVDGNLYYKNEDGEYQPIDLSDLLDTMQDLLGRVQALEDMWFINNDNRIEAKHSRAVVGAGFYDSTINA